MYQTQLLFLFNTVTGFGLQDYHQACV